MQVVSKLFWWERIQKKNNDSVKCKLKQGGRDFCNEKGLSIIEDDAAIPYPASDVDA